MEFVHKKGGKHALPGVFSLLIDFLEGAPDTKSAAFGVLIGISGSEFGRLLSPFANKPRTAAIMTFFGQNCEL